MTIFVKTKTFQETLAFDANDWETDDEGRLWIGTGEVGVAEFNTGEWLYVYETTEEETKPRVWHSVKELAAIENALVVDRDGDPHRTRYISNHLEWLWLDEFAPFTEVLDA